MSFERAQAAFRKGAFDDALGLLTKVVRDDPGHVDAHLLLGRCFLEGGQFSTAFQVCKALILHPEIRLHVPLPREELDDLMVDTLLRWGTSFENAGFPKSELEPFGKAVAVYADYPGRRSADMRDLLEGLRQGRFVSARIRRP